MRNPWLILGVPLEADDAAIRRAYLERVREFPPDRFPARFQAIQAAYDLVKTRWARLEYRLFNTRPPAETPLAAFAQAAWEKGGRRPPSRDALMELLRTCAKK